MATLRDFAKRINKIDKKFLKKSNEAVKERAAFLLQQLLINTPVDTSKAISNWRVGLGGPAEGTIGPHIPGFGGSTRDRSGEVALNRGLAQIKQRRPGVPLHITNNVDYIGDLDRGTSRQAPLGIVAVSLVRTRIKFSG